MRIVVSVDPEKCLGTGVCVGLAPGLFDLEQQGYAVPKKADVGLEDLDTLRDAEASCPAAAITVEVIATEP